MNAGWQRGLEDVRNELRRELWAALKSRDYATATLLMHKVSLISFQLDDANRPMERGNT